MLVTGSQKHILPVVFEGSRNNKIRLVQITVFIIVLLEMAKPADLPESVRREGVKGGFLTTPCLVRAAVGCVAYIQGVRPRGLGGSMQQIIAIFGQRS